VRRDRALELLRAVAAGALPPEGAIEQLARSPFESVAPQVPGGRGSYDVPRPLPLAMTPVWTGKLAHSAELAALPYQTGMKNLTLTGEQVLPSLGVEGALAAGWSAAKIACEIAGKKKDYLQNEHVGVA